jgi:ATP-dependent Zn protease
MTETDKAISTHSEARRDLLARAYLDMLAREAGGSAKPLLRSNDPDDPIDALLDDLAPGDADASRTSIRVDLAVAAVLTARAIEAEGDLVRKLRRGSPVVIIATHVSDIVQLVNDVICACAFPQGTLISETRVSPSHDRCAVVIARDGAGNDHKPEKGNDVVGSALHARCPIVGIAADPSRHLPRDLMRAGEVQISIGQLDASAVALVIEAVTGRPPSFEIDPDLLRAADISDLQLAVRSDRGPDECLSRLAEVVRNRGHFDGDGPSLEELVGYGAAKTWGLELAADLKAFRRGEIGWENCEKGLLLAGAPGVGKTQYAKALAKSAGVPIVSTSIADWNAANHLSGALQAMRNAFAQARRLAPSILFIDEIDGIGDRATLQGAEHILYWSQLVIQLLAGIEDRPGVVVISASNHPQNIDMAILRSGRLDRTITIEKPDVEDLVGILGFHLKGDLKDANLVPVALAASGGTGADVEAWVRRAKSKARRAHRAVTVDDLLLEVRGSRKPLSDFLKNAYGFHEAGHVVVAKVIGGFEVGAVSVNDAGGMTHVGSPADQTQTLSGLEGLITMLLGGRAAELEALAPEELTAGAGAGDDSDLERCTKIAVDIECRFGLGSRIAHLPAKTIELSLYHPDLLARVEQTLAKCLTRARAILAAHRDDLCLLAAAIRDRGHLNRSEIDAVLAPRDSKHSPTEQTAGRLFEPEANRRVDEGQPEPAPEVGVHSVLNIGSKILVTLPFDPESVKRLNNGLRHRCDADGRGGMVE